VPPRLRSQAATSCGATAAPKFVSAARGASRRRQRRCKADYKHAQTAYVRRSSHRVATWRFLLHVVICCTLCVSEYNELSVKSLCGATTGFVGADHACVGMCCLSDRADKETTLRSKLSRGAKVGSANTHGVYKAAHCATDGDPPVSTRHIRHEFSMKTAINDKGTIGKRRTSRFKVRATRKQGSHATHGRRGQWHTPIPHRRYPRCRQKQLRRQRLVHVLVDLRLLADFLALVRPREAILLLRSVTSTLLCDL